MPIQNFTAKNIGPRVALLGHRGIPNRYGGFEYLMEELAARLVSRGCQVTAYCRSRYFPEKPAFFKGARLVYLPIVSNKFLETLFHTLLSVLHALFTDSADTLIVVNVGNAPAAWLAKIFGKKVILCVDGLDWQRKKWNVFARRYLAACSYLAKYAAHEVVTDSDCVQEFYQGRRGAVSTHIPYGVEIETDLTIGEDYLTELGLKSKQYFIYVARLEPENNPLLVVKAFVASGSKMPLVVIGGNRYHPEYLEQIKAAANDKVIFLGAVFGGRVKQLIKNSLCYIRAAEVGGLSPAVIEAMGRGVCVLANDRPENREALDGAGLFYDINNHVSLAFQIYLISQKPQQALELGRRLALRAGLIYNWDSVVKRYYDLAAAPKRAGASIWGRLAAFYRRSQI